ncbi:hypothetical protein FOPG_18442 [Fusarium oxysporum f. sp. conglutinans race 2 54008]|uniref:Uncharacterized protein n=1 Tax=Fusarium oxysporum f. sp. conglutinans race 2 54008 TaxID=1089457 RepID=X0HW17_FUSOX|nr:hypothetical protein FOPG_18442 [Fusarium oxysporum f. sp. conglutinans race 2 54008]
MPVRRSLQTPDPDEPYLTKGHDVTRKIEQAIKKDDHGELRFLNLEIEELGKLEGKLLRGVNLIRREREFVKALRGGLHNKWLEAIWWQAKKVLEKTEPR